jgi:hypothetical protein
VTCDWGWCDHPASGWRQQVIIIGQPPYRAWLPVCACCHQPAELVLAA